MFHSKDSIGDKILKDLKKLYDEKNLDLPKYCKTMYEN